MLQGSNGHRVCHGGYGAKLETWLRPWPRAICFSDSGAEQILETLLLTKHKARGSGISVSVFPLRSCLPRGECRGGGARQGRAPHDPNALQEHTRTKICRLLLPMPFSPWISKAWGLGSQDRHPEGFGCALLGSATLTAQAKPTELSRDGWVGRLCPTRAQHVDLGGFGCCHPSFSALLLGTTTPRPWLLAEHPGGVTTPSPSALPSRTVRTSATWPTTTPTATQPSW